VVVDLRDSIHSVSNSVAKAVDVAEELPGELQTQVSRTLDEIEAKQPQLQQTLRETGTVVDNARQTVTEVRGALNDANTTVEAADRIAANFAEAGKVWKPTVTEFRALYRELEGEKDPNAPPPDPDAPDDLENLARTAEGLTSAAIELRGTVAEVRGLLESEAPDKINATAVATVDHAAEKVSGIVSGLIWQLLLLAFGIAVVVLGYRFAASRILKGS
jgi:ABC-type transporter Mla subunit MlaD